MSPAALSAFLLAGFALAGSPGPNTLSLAAAGAAFGPRPSLRYLLGLTFGMLVVMLLVGTGTVGLLLAIPGAAPAAAILALVYFLYLAWRIATAPPLTAAGAERSRPTARDGIVLSLLNPKGYIAMLALFSGPALIALRGVADLALKIGLLLAIILGVNIAWLFAGGMLSSLIRRPRTGRALNIAFAALLLASAVLLLPL